MTRRLRPLTADFMPGLDRACDSCVFWETREPLEARCGAACDEEQLRAWFSTVHQEWGECGRVALEDKMPFGFIKYAPARYFPQARWLAVGAPDGSEPLITCLHVLEDARCHGLDRVLLQAALRDLHGRGARSVYAYGFTSGDFPDAPMPELEFLLGQGFTIERPHPAFPLLRLDMRTLAAWTENLEAALESLLLPLGRARRMPTPSIE